MKKEIDEKFVKTQLEQLREGLSAEEKLISTEVINQEWLDEIDGPITMVAWELFQLICDVEPEDNIKINDIQFGAFCDYICGRKPYKSIDEFIEWFNKIAIK